MICVDDLLGYDFNAKKIRPRSQIGVRISDRRTWSENFLRRIKTFVALILNYDDSC